MRHIRLPRRLLAAIWLLAAVAAPALAAERRVALVVGNGAYAYVGPLSNSVSDAKLMAASLRALGFQLVGGGPMLDLDKAGFDRAVEQFGHELVGADVALFYYAGHGVQVRGENYLVPVSANPTREADVDFQMVDAQLVLRQMGAAGTRLNVMVLDACRNNPFGGRGLRAAGGGLAQMQAPEGTLISFATQPGNVAADGQDGHSPYTRALVAAMQLPGQGVFDVFNRVGLQVKKVTQGEQQPWLSSSPIEGQFFFTPPSAQAAPAPILPAPTVATPAAPPPQPAPPQPSPQRMAANAAPAPVARASDDPSQKAAKCRVPHIAFSRTSVNAFTPVTLVTSADGWCWAEPTNGRGTGLAGEIRLRPTHGELRIVDGDAGGNRYAYRPAPGYVGPDHFQFVVFPLGLMMDVTVDVQPAS